MHNQQPLNRASRIQIKPGTICGDCNQQPATTTADNTPICQQCGRLREQAVNSQPPTITRTEYHNREHAENHGYATYNNGQHICVTLADEPTTITVKTPDGQLLTFGFNPRPVGAGFQSVDIVNHSGPKNDAGNPLQSALLLGQGPTVATTKPTDNTPTTVVVVQFPETKPEPQRPIVNGFTI